MIPARFEALGEGRFRGSLDASWCQGPGIYGGLVAAVLGDALERTFAGRELRALSVHLCAPAPPGPLEVVVHEERRGSAVTFATARLFGPDGLPAVVASATLARDRSMDADFDVSVAPVLPAPDSIPDLGSPPGVPVFTRHFHLRFGEGVPFTGQDRAVSAGWLRPRVPEPLSTSLALALLDVWPLALLPKLPGPRPAASVVIHFQLLPPLRTVADDAWYQVRAVSEVTRGGYSDQTSSLWDASGRLVGRCQQLVALVR